MSKYEEFITNLKEEVNNIEVIDRKKQIKYKYLNKEKKSYKGFFKLGLSALTFLIILIVSIVSLSTPTIPVKPIISSNVDESYAFELMAAANHLYTSDTSKLSLMKLSNKNIEDVSKDIHSHFLTMRQLLVKSKVDFKVTTSEIVGYEYQMEINPIVNEGLSLKYTLYFNKTLKEHDDDEEVYDLDGVMIINNNEYRIIGTTEIEDDEVETEIKVILSNNSYFLIEQEKEEDEYEYVYMEYLDNKLISKYELSYEIDHNEIEVVIEIESIDIKGKIKAKQKNNQMTLKVDLDSYKGEVKVTEDSNNIIYYFKDEKKEIKFKIF